MTTLTYGTVTGRFDDTFPGEVVAISGTVTFVAEADYLLSPDTTPKATMLPTPKTVELVGNAFTVDLLGTDNASLNPLDWTYRVYFQLVANNASIKRDPISIAVPSGVTTDLADAMPVAASEGNAIVRGPQGIQGEIGLTGPVGPVSTVPGPQGIQGPVGPVSTVPGPQGIQGVKGDPGGFTAGTDLGTSDLNTILTPGLYRQGVSANVTLANNYPIVGANGTGVLVAIQQGASGSGGMLQQFTPVWGNQTGRVTFQRTYANSVWSSWFAMPSNRIDQTAGRVIYQWDTLNGREQLIYGDTGVRRVETLFVNGWTAAIASLRRTNNIVQLGLYTVSPTAQTAATAFAIPVGFRPGSFGGNTAYACRSLNSSGSGWCTITGSGDVQPDTVYGTFNGSIQLMTWTTSDTWPTTLPGTASGSIPNV
ncbi:hypothetical protein [Arthrobacter sp. NPDC056493]|uniref:pyocin knob domain-containing protein n=1 Tax=Arthrobacter sp. NPDC056493 TaxID=3345839 RepID=UPI00366C8AB7